MKRAVIILFFIIFSCANETTEGNNSSKIGFYSTPDEVITALHKRKLGYREHYMLGHAYRQKKMLKKSVRHFANSCFKYHRKTKLVHYPNPVYRFIKGFHIKSEYYYDGAYELASLYYTYREHKYVVKFADLVPESRSALYRDAVILKSRSLVALKRTDEAIESLNDILSEFEDRTSRAKILIRLASVYEKRENYEDSVKSYLKVIDLEENSWQASVAVKNIMSILPKTSYKLDGNETVKAAGALYYARKYDEVISMLSAGSLRGKQRFAAAVYLVKAYTRKREIRKAMGLVKRYKRNRKKFNELLKSHGDVLWVRRQRAKAISVYKNIISSGIEPYAKESLRRVALYMEDRRRNGFEGYLKKYISKYGNDSTAEKFLWLLGRNAIRDNNLSSAEKYLLTAIEDFPEGSYSDRSRFWLYKLNIWAGKKSEALKYAKQSVAINPNSSYTWRLMKSLVKGNSIDLLEKRFVEARSKGQRQDLLFYHFLLFVKEKDYAKRNSRLRYIDLPEKGKLDSYNASIESLDYDSEYATLFSGVERYFAAGYMTGILKELQLIPDTEEGKISKYIALANFGNKYNNNYLSVYGSIQLLQLNKLKENLALMPENAARRLLPKPFLSCVKKYSKKYRVSENMVYSVVKAESLFNHNAVSSARAVGLMQLMPATARGIARDIKLGRNYNLKNPCTSIHFGTQYLSWLDRYLNGVFEYIVAGYNGGAGNVKKWQKRFKSKDMDYFTEFVPFYETRYYILRTEKFLTQYNVVYGN